MELTYVDILGLRIMEPVTSLTDLLAAGVAFFCFARLAAIRRREAACQAFARFFLMLGVAGSFAGILGHALVAVIGPQWKVIGWVASALAIYWLEKSAISFAGGLMSDRLTAGLARLPAIKLAFFLAVTLGLAVAGFEATMGFAVVQANIAVGMVLVVAPLHAFAAVRRHERGHALVVTSVAAGAILPVVYNAQLTLQTWFNYHDLSHTLFAGLIYLFYRAARTLATAALLKAGEKVTRVAPSGGATTPWTLSNTDT